MKLLPPKNSPITRVLLTLCSVLPAFAQRPPAPVVDTGQILCFDTFEPIRTPSEGRDFYGQDAQYAGLQAHYQDNGDCTVTDLNTGLMWSQKVDRDKVTAAQAKQVGDSMTLAGHNDWRVPTIKELYSLMDFRGVTGLMHHGSSGIPDNAVPYINTDFFEFRYGETKNDERFIDSQWVTSNMSVSKIMHNSDGMFGVNFADGRIKCYGLQAMHGRSEKTFYARYVRGRSDYGVNDYVDNEDGTISDQATGLTWAQADSGQGMTWEDALKYAEALELGGHSDWRLPNIKELQSIVDYSRSPDATNSPAIDPIFQTSSIQNEANQTDYPFFWSSTTHLDGPNAINATYIAFGRGIGQMHEQVMDVHGTGCQRSDPKEGEAALGHGPQGDAQRILNYVRCVRGGALQVDPRKAYAKPKKSEYPNRIRLADTTYTPKENTYHEAPNGGPGYMQQEGPRGMGPPNGQHPPHGMGPPPRR